jgi:hypothetical protein
MVKKGKKEGKNPVLSISPNFPSLLLGSVMDCSLGKQAYCFSGIHYNRGL